MSRARVRRAGSLLLEPHRVALAAILAGSALLEFNRLSQNGYANVFYAAGVKSMLHSLHNFLFVSFDSGGLVMMDKPPLALWLQTASAKVFGFSPLPLLFPQALLAVLAVALTYRMLAVRCGRPAALAAALVLAVFPSFVAVSRENGVDTLMIVLMLLACGAALRAIESARLRDLCASAVFVGLAFNTKALAGLLVVPAIVLGYAVCAPASIARRARALLLAGAVLLPICAAWITVVELTPASARPYVGGSRNNTELGLTFEYNGFGRVGGQTGGPGHIPTAGGAIPHTLRGSRSAAMHARPRETAPGPPRALGSARRSSTHGHGNGRPRAHLPVAFAGPPGPLRLFGTGLGDQGAWLIPLALIGMLACALVALSGRVRAQELRDSSDGRDARATTNAPHARDAQGAGARAAPRASARQSLPVLIVLGGWFLTEAIVLSTSKGIVHPYYISALAPGCAAMAGVGAVALARLAQEHHLGWRSVLAPAALLATAAAQVVLMRREHYMAWFEPLLIAGALAGSVALLALHRSALAAMGAALCLLLVVPAGYASSTWLAPVEGTFPAAGPTQAAGAGGVGVRGAPLRHVRALVSYVRTHRPGTRWAILTDASVTASPMMLLGLPAGAIAGYSGTDPVLDGRDLARLTARREARYVVLGGEFSTRGGNRATAAVLRACAQLAPQVWGAEPTYIHGLVLFDCAGRERALARE